MSGVARGAVLAGPRKFVRKMRRGIQKYAEIVRSLCGGAPGTILAEYWDGASVNVRAQISQFLLNFWEEPSMDQYQCRGKL